MRHFDLMFDPGCQQPEGRVEMYAHYCDAVFGWAARHASGCKLEIFEDGASLGGLKLDPENGFWTVYPSSGRPVEG